jgi:hypothetical protein
LPRVWYSRKSISSTSDKTHHCDWRHTSLFWIWVQLSPFPGFLGSQTSIFYPIAALKSITPKKKKKSVLNTSHRNVIRH